MAAAQPAAPALKVPRGRTPSGAIDYLSLSFGGPAGGDGCLVRPPAREGNRPRRPDPRDGQARTPADRLGIRVVQDRGGARHHRSRNGAAKFPVVREALAAEGSRGDPDRSGSFAGVPAHLPDGRGPRSCQRLPHGADPESRRGACRNGGLRTRRARGDPLYLGIDRRPEGGLLRARNVRRAGPADPRDLRDRARRGRPSFASDLRPFQPGSRDDERHSGD